MMMDQKIYPIRNKDRHQHSACIQSAFGHTKMAIKALDKALDLTGIDDDDDKGSGQGLTQDGVNEIKCGLDYLIAAHGWIGGVPRFGMSDKVDALSDYTQEVLDRIDKSVEDDKAEVGEGERLKSYTVVVAKPDGGVLKATIHNVTDYAWKASGVHIFNGETSIASFQTSQVLAITEVAP